MVKNAGIFALRSTRPYCRVVCGVLAPDSDAALFNHLLARIDEQGALDASFIAHTSGLDAALDAARNDDTEATGLSADALAAFCRLWIVTERVVTIYSESVNQSTSGTDKVNAILNCHLATGRIGKPGCGPFSVTGQPNAMGGRAVGGLANMLACHLDLENADHRAAVRALWNAPAMPDTAGLKAVDMVRADAPHPGIRAHGPDRRAGRGGDHHRLWPARERGGGGRAHAAGRGLVWFRGIRQADAARLRLSGAGRDARGVSRRAGRNDRDRRAQKRETAA